MKLPDCPARSLDPSRPCALLADLHANWQALSAVDAWLGERGIDQVIVLGDLVGYGASPREVVELVAERGWIAIRGNHEEMLLGMAPESFFAKERALRAIAWSASQLSASHRSFLAALPTAVELLPEVIAVHGSIADPRRCYAYIYDLSLELNIRRLRELGAPPGTLLLHGHTHRSAIFAAADGRSMALAATSRTQRLDRAAWHFVNPGSVGYPRDGDPRASFFLLWLERRELEPIRLDYDLDAAVRKIRQAGYDDTMADRLLQAR